MRGTNVQHEEHRRLCYRLDPGTVDCTSSDLVVDYEVQRLSWRSGGTICAELEDVKGVFDEILLQAHAFDAYAQNERDIAAARSLLKEGAELEVRVRLRGGARGVEGMLRQLFKEVRIRRVKDLKVIRARRPRDLPFEAKSFEIEFDDLHSKRVLTFATRPGLFSPRRIDEGTSRLLAWLGGVPGKTVLDVGCGYGAIGVTLASRGAKVTLLDSDARAVKLARVNLKRNRLSGATLLAHNLRGFPCASFDLVAANPPTHAGSPLLRELLTDMIRISRRKGQMAVVVRSQLNYEKWLRGMGQIQYHDVGQGYKVIAVKPSN